MTIFWVPERFRCILGLQKISGVSGTIQEYFSGISVMSSKWQKVLATIEIANAPYKTKKCTI